MWRWYLIVGLLVGCTEVGPEKSITYQDWPDDGHKAKPQHVEEHADGTPNLMVCKVQRDIFKSKYLGYAYQANGLAVYFFDYNHDTKFDTLISIPQGDVVSRWAHFYTYDLDFDGEPEITYVDKTRDGSCKLKTYWIAPKKRGHHDEQQKNARSTEDRKNNS